jgi:hypothetical protein
MIVPPCAAIVGVTAVYRFEDCECLLVAQDMETLQRLWGRLTDVPLEDAHCQHVLITEDHDEDQGFG